ncbi:MAG TPA: FAD-binding oxidoreductase, partial [Usitatibacter sp.]|nr:FAD-binding oxidoreductase [Usitatibacter sp.]
KPPGKGADLVSFHRNAGIPGNSYYEATVRRPPPAARLAGRIEADVAVVGGGYAGLSCALDLAGRGYSVALLEARRIGWGASGRNGGEVIVGVGFDGEQALEAQLAPAEAKRAWDVTVEGLALLQERMRRHAIDCEYRPGYLSLAVKPRRWGTLRRWAEHVSRDYGYPHLQLVGPAEIRERVASERYYAAVHDAGSGHLHPLKYCLGLAQAAREAGVRIHEESAVVRIAHGARPVLATATGEVACRFALLAGNVYLDEYGRGIAPGIARRIVPVATYIVATEPMGRERADALMRGRPAASDTNHILDYFRVSADDRLLFGAGESASTREPPGLVAAVRRRMLRAFPQLADLAIPYAWGGFVDLTLNEAPDFGRLAPNVYYLQGFSGHGLALAGMAGRMVAEAIGGQAERFDIFASIRHRDFPGGRWMRKPALALGMLYYRMLDLL